MMLFQAAGFVGPPLRVGDREFSAAQVAGTVPEVPFPIILEPGSDRTEIATVVDVHDDHRHAFTLERGQEGTEEVEHPAGSPWVVQAAGG